MTGKKKKHMGSQEKANILKTLPPLAFSTPATNATFEIVW